MNCGIFKLKSEAIAARAVAEDTIDKYIKSTFNVENSATLTTEQRVTLLNWWKNKKKMDKSLIIREDGLPTGIYLIDNGKHVSCVCLLYFVRSYTESCFHCVFLSRELWFVNKIVCWNLAIIPILMRPKLSEQQ